jgi:lipopolysaccharide export system protein LptA
MTDAHASVPRQVLPVILLLCLLPLCSLWASDPISFSADKVRSVFASGREETILTGHASIKTGDIEIQADAIRLYGAKQRYIESTGSVSLRDNKRQVNLAGDGVFYDRESEILKVNGNAVMEDFKNEMVVRGGILESRNKENISIIQVGVRVFKKDIIARSEMLVYRRDEDMVELSGLPVVNKKKDEYRASIITINLKTEEIQLTGRVQGNVQAKNDNSSSPAASASPQAGTSTAPVPSPAGDPQPGPAPTGPAPAPGETAAPPPAGSQ